MIAVYRAKLNHMGRVTIPVPCRESSGLRAGQEVCLTITDRGILVYQEEK